MNPSPLRRVKDLARPPRFYPLIVLIVFTSSRSAASTIVIDAEFS